jgi:hypothetical protein
VAIDADDLAGGNMLAFPVLKGANVWVWRSFGSGAPNAKPPYLPNRQMSALGQKQAFA